MNIEPNKFYRTRDGRTAWVATIDNPFSETFPVLGSIESQGISRCVRSWTLEGKIRLSGKTDEDIVEEIRDDDDNGNYAVVGGVKYLLVKDEDWTCPF